MTRLILIIALFFAITIDITAQTEAVAKSGDGIYTLLKRHGLDYKSDYKTFLELNKKKLNGATALKVGEKYFIPKKQNSNTSSGTKGQFPIFGSKYADITTIDNSLAGAIYYIVGGHGGPDPGAVGKKDGHLLCEDEYAYDIAARLARELLCHGATAYLITRDPNDGIRDDKYLEPDKDELVYKKSAFKGGQTSRLRQKAAAINTLSRKHKGAYQRVVVLHLDSRQQKQNIDIFFYYHSAAGKKLATTMLNTIEQKYKKHQPNRGYKGSVSKRNLYMLKVPQPVGVFIELGNIQNSHDQKRFLIKENRQAVAKWLSDGLIKAYKTR